MFAAADVCGIDRSLCIPGDLDLYDICCEPDLTDFVYFLSGIMDNYVFGAYGVLWDCAAAGRENRLTDKDLSGIIKRRSAGNDKNKGDKVWDLKSYVYRLWMREGCLRIPGTGPGLRS